LRRRTFHHLVAIACVALTPAVQGQPTGVPLKIVVGNAPGGITDTLARVMAEQLAPALARPVIVENKPGASGNIAADFVAKAPPDGNTLLFIYNAHPSIKSLFPQLPFDPVADFRSVGMLAGTPYLLVANPAVPGQNLSEALASAKRSGKPLTFASPGAGSPQHLMAERLRLQSGVPITVVHYKGLAPGQSDVIAGHVDFTISSVALGLPQVKAGKAKVLAVTSEERLPQLPGTPTVKESGLDGFVSLGWMGLLLPAKTPTAIAQRYNAEVNRILGKADVKARLEGMGAVPLPGAPEVLDRTIQEESVMWGKIIKDLGIKPE
jgi:tripartite-type tricarboxylate transporter receptor subunit TctC